jgi:DNA-binding CsgD family transcriptional regulator
MATLARMLTGPGVILLDERGRLRAATAVAERLLALVSSPDRREGALRVLAGRLAVTDAERPVVISLPTDAGEQLLLTGARAGQELTAVVELRGPAPDAPAATGFTRRERDVLDLVVQGLPTKLIANRLSISPWTVQQHVGSMFAKAGVSTRGELTALVHAHAHAS